MVSLTPRAQQILAVLLSAKAAMPLSQVAEALGIPERAVRYDLELGSVWLKHQGLKLETQSGVGAWIKGSQADKVQASRRLGSLHVSQLNLNPEDRRVVALAILLGAGEPGQACDYERLTELLGISHRTAYSDLVDLRKYLAAKDVTLSRRADGSFHIQGPEVALREIAFRLMERWGAERVWKYLRAGPDSPDAELYRLELGSVGCFVATLLAHVDPEPLVRAVQAGQESMKASFAEPDVFPLLLKLALLVRRVLKGYVTVEPVLDTALLSTLPEAAAAASVARGIENAYGCRLPTGEVSLITLYVLATKTATHPGSPAMPEDVLSKLAGHIVDDLVSDVSDRLGLDLGVDSMLREDLRAHLKPVLIRLAFSMKIRNPLEDQVREDYPILYRVVEAAASEVVAPLVGPVPSSELAYLTMHFGAALERAPRFTGQRLKALVVCSSGIATSRILASRLEREFSRLDVVDIRPTASVDISKLPDVDLVVSTTPLQCEVPVVVVNPLLPAGDLSALAEKLRALERKGLTEPSTATRAALTPSRMRSSLCLAELLHHGLVSVSLPVQDSEQAIREAGRLLVLDGAVEERYVEAMVRTYREVGPYIVIAAGVALPHARPEDGAIRVGLSVVTLADPVPFGHRTNDPVSVVFAFAGIDYFSHLRAFTELASLFRDPERLAAVRQARTADELLTVILSAVT
ncbi:MAG TPA: hypothetical protein DHW14_01100 [Clostridiales bacterium]|nr:hypothetical protein [Clostridiales bacterium]